MTGSRASARTERGALVLPVVLALLGLAGLASWSQRLPVALRQAQAVRVWQQARAEAAAQAGLDWAWALANTTAALDDDCRVAPAGGAATATARERWWTADAAGRALPRGSEAACVLLDAGWRCHCPADGAATPDLATAAADPPAPGFRVRFAPATGDGQVRLQVDGCLPWRADCEAAPATAVRPGPPPGAPPPPGDAPRARLTLAWHGGGHRPLPPAPLLALGDVSLGPDTRLLGPADGPVLVSGGAVRREPMATVIGAPGAPGADLLSGQRRDWQDDAAAPVPSARRRLAFAALGADLPLAGRGPSVHRPACGLSGHCTAGELQAAWATQGQGWLWVDGDLQLEGPLDVGDAQRPLALVVTGRLAWRGSGRWRGLVLVGGEAVLQAEPPGLRVEGALLGLDRVRLLGPLSLVHDPPLLRRWRWASMPWMPRPGTWSDLPAGP